jgi:hypothetical protein
MKQRPVLIRFFLFITVFTFAMSGLAFGGCIATYSLTAQGPAFHAGQTQGAALACSCAETVPVASGSEPLKHCSICSEYDPDAVSEFVDGKTLVFLIDYVPSQKFIAILNPSYPIHKPPQVQPS